MNNENETPKNQSAVELGRMAKGRPKSFSAEERERRRQHMIALNAKRKQEKEKQ